MLGFHVNKTISKGGRKKTRDMATAMKTDVDVIRNWGFARPAAQLFVTGPRDFHRSITPEDAAAIKQTVADGATVVIHGAYVDNPWNLAAGAVHNIKQEMIIAHEIGATGVIVHLAAGASTDSLGQVLHTIATLPAAVKAATTLWLEIHTAKSSPATYETTAKINKLFERIVALGLDGLRVGLCIDTAHLFACGMALDTYAKAKKWIEDLEPTIPLMMHLNDSESSLGSGIDKHERLCCGYLWGEYHPDDGILPFAGSGLAFLLEWAESHNIVTILERDYDGADEDLALIHRMGFFLA